MSDTETPPLDTVFGDFVKNEDEEYDVEELAEPWHRMIQQQWTINMFSILIRLGEVLNERYLVEYKLGFGGGSTVWMALDLRDRENVALKVMMTPGEWGENEIRIQDEIIKNVHDTSHLVIYIATFFLPRDNGSRHRVLVYPLMGLCIDLPTLEKIPMATHLYERNCMWGMTSLNGLSTSAKYEALGRPLKQIIPFVDPWKFLETDIRKNSTLVTSVYRKSFPILSFNAATHLCNITPQTDFINKIQASPVICGAI
ncbi:hypothetical protein N7519_005020 [Penicillium mononematosum]|uniref:uncharacterized protein n=1 Tax=Penicillium mononematosum TaxID=268346 RepID=UPI00254894CD|nr:uncharacterized protein N7519_005020 [Penicillium mononematosum]KAJ6183719.1 hypothetical protein N7519_005020 [Penicillium mononematosum]